MDKKTSNTTYVYIIALLLFIVGIGYLAFIGFYENSVYFLNVKEAIAMPSEKLKSARLFFIFISEHYTQQHGKTISFQLRDKEYPSNVISVEYTGVIPDTFRTGAEAIVEGSLTPEGIFQEKTSMTKCPSKYEKEKKKS